MACRLRGAGQDPRRFVDRDALDWLGVGRAEPNEIGDACGAAVGEFLPDVSDLRVGGQISVQEAEEERVLLDEFEVARDAGADHLLDGSAFGRLSERSRSCCAWSSRSVMCSSRLEPKWSYRTEGTTPARAAMSCIFAAV